MKRTFPALVVAVSLALLAPERGEACMHEVEAVKYDAVASVGRAERLLARGDALAAYRAARRARHELERELRRDPSQAHLSAVIDRATRVTAVAVVRLDGWTPISRRAARRHVTRGREARSLAWAVERLRAFAEAHPEDLVARARYAEALAHLPSGADEARRLLEDLARRDLMPDAHGYAVLVALLDPGSDAWAEALGRCQAMAADLAQTLCPSSSDPSS